LIIFEISGNEDSGSNYALGKLSYGRDGIGKEVLWKLRRFLEESDIVDGFFTYSSCGGGTGSGYLTELSENFHDHFKSPKKYSHVVIPSPNFSTTVVEPYNCLFHLTRVQDIAIHFLYDNESMSKALSTSNVSGTNFEEINTLHAQVCSSITLSNRFPAEMDLKYEHILTNLVPFPESNRLLCSIHPTPGLYGKEKDLTIPGMVAMCFKEPKEFCAVDMNEGEYIACCLLFRGNSKDVFSDVFVSTEHIKDEYKVKFQEWVPSFLKIGICKKELAYGKHFLKQSVLKVSNHTGISNALKPIADRFESMFDKRLFVHWFVKEGIEEMEFADVLEHFCGTLHGLKLEDHADEGLDLDDDDE